MHLLVDLYPLARLFLKSPGIFYALGGFALFLLFVSPRDAFAFTSNDLSNGLVNGGSIWLETTLIVALSHVSVLAFSLQIARGYFIRVLNKFNLKLGADIWWLAYVLIRDALIILSFVMGLLVFLPGTFLDYPMAVPFMPVAVVCFGAALVTKLYVDADDNRNAFRLVTILIFSGTLLWVSGTVFITESPLQLSTLPPGVSATGGFWYTMAQTFSSQSNLALTMASFEVCFSALAVIGICGLLHSIFHWRVSPRRKTDTGSVYPNPAVSSAPAVRTLPLRDADTSNSPFLSRFGNNLNSKMDLRPSDALNNESERNYVHRLSQPANKIYRIIFRKQP